jgi:hypothetical protein
MSALTVLLLTLALVVPTQGGLPPYAKNFFKSCWCQKQRQCQKAPENSLMYTDNKRGLQYQCQNCNPSQLAERKTTFALTLQFEKLVAVKTRTCTREL